MSKLIPAMGNVIIKIDESPKMLSSGLIIPEQAREVQDTGIVVETSAGQRSARGKIVPLDFNVGDRVLLAVTLAGAEIDYDGVKVVVVPVTEIAAVLT